MENPLVIVRESTIRPGEKYLDTLNARDIRGLFGIRKGVVLPDFAETAYLGPRGKVTITIFPRHYAIVKLSKRPHRVFATCPKCAKFIPFGRMHQHIKRKDHQS